MVMWVVCNRPSCSTQFRIPYLEVIEEAVFAHAAEFNLRLRRVDDACGLEVGDQLAVEGEAHGVAQGLQHERVRGLEIEAEGESRVVCAGGRGRNDNDSSC